MRSEESRRRSSEDHKNWRKNNPEKARLRDKLHYERHKEKIKARARKQSKLRPPDKEYQKEYAKKNRKKLLAQARARYIPVPYGKGAREQARREGLRSGFERTLVMQMRKAKVPFQYESLKLPYSIDHTYIPDFVLPNGVIIEVKGKLDAITRSKMLAVKRAHPHLDIRLVFMRGENKLSKRSKTTYLSWAEKNGFPCADGAIPEEWLKE